MPTRNSHEEIPTRVSTAIEASVKEASEVPLSIPPELQPERSDPPYPISQRFLTLLPVGVDHAGSVSRADLMRRGRGLSPTSTDEEIETFLLLVNAWGFGSSGYGPWRTQQVLESERFFPSARRALEILHSDSPDAALSAYFHLNNKAHGRVPWWGPAFFTKFLTFADPANSVEGVERQGALILDRWMATAVRRIAAHTSFPNGGWTTPQYAYYLTLLSRLCESAALGRSASPLDAERALYALYTGR